MFGLMTPPWTRAEAVFAVAFVALVLALGVDPAVRDALRFDRALIAGGEWWRLLTGNFVHLGAGHLWLDVLGLSLLLLFFRDVFSPGLWTLATLAGALAVGGGLWLLNPALQGYLGISGVLHTLLFAGLLLSFRHSPVVNGVVFAAMCARLWSEQQAGYDVLQMQDVIGGAIAVDAHLYGALASLPVAALCWRSSQARQMRFREADRVR